MFQTIVVLLVIAVLVALAVINAGFICDTISTLWNQETDPTGRQPE